MSTQCPGTKIRIRARSDGKVSWAQELIPSPVHVVLSLSCSCYFPNFAWLAVLKRPFPARCTVEKRWLLVNLVQTPSLPSETFPRARSLQAIRALFYIRGPNYIHHMIRPIGYIYQSDVHELVLSATHQCPLNEPWLRTLSNSEVLHLHTT